MNIGPQIFLFVFFLSISMYGQDAPPVFQTGEHDKSYEMIVSSHPDMLLRVCDNSMDKAYLLWTNMLRDIETLAEEKDYDIKGVKIWINAFWDKDGRIEHIVFYPKPTSRNIDYEEFDQFLESIVDQLNINVVSQSAFSHYGSASFPIFNHLHRSQGN